MPGYHGRKRNYANMRAAWNAAAGAYYAGKGWYGQKRQKTGGRRIRSAQGVTRENDRHPVYRRKRMPRKKRRRWVRKVKMNQFMDLKQLGTRTIVFNKALEPSNHTAGNHGVEHVALYGAKSPTYTHLNDLTYIATNDNVGNPTAASGVTVNKATKMMFCSAVLDLTIRNSSYSNDEAELSSGAITLEIDIYEIISKRRWVSHDDANGLEVYERMNLLFDAAELERFGINNANGLDYRHRGTTPFDHGHCIQRYGLKILKKTKYKLGNGNSLTYQMRDPKTHIASRIALVEHTGPNKPGWTRHLWIVYKAVPGITIGVTSGTAVEQISLGVTRKYTYKIEGGNDKRASYIAST